MKTRSKIFVVLAALCSPFIALAQSSAVQSITQQANTFPSTQMNLGTFVQALLKYANSLTSVLALAAILFFFYGLVRYIYDAGNSKGHERGRQTIILGLIGLFVVFSLGGILQLLQSFFFS